MHPVKIPKRDLSGCLPIARSHFSAMEQALRSAHGSKKIWDLVHAEPSLDNQEKYVDTIELLLKFTSLWTRSPHFLAPDPALQRISTDLASRAYLTLVVLQEEKASAEQSAKLRELWEGPVDDYRPIAGLLENHRWRSTAHRPDGILRCSKLDRHRVATSADRVCLPTGDIIEERIRHVYRRLVTSPRLPLSQDEFDSCAIVWLAYDRGLHNLTRWQRAVVSLFARSAARHLRVKRRVHERRQPTRPSHMLTLFYIVRHSQIAVKAHEVSAVIFPFGVGLRRCLS